MCVKNETESDTAVGLRFDFIGFHQWQLVPMRCLGEKTVTNIFMFPMFFFFFFGNVLTGATSFFLFIFVFKRQ